VARRGGWRPGTRPRWPLTALTLLANSSSARRAVNATSTTTSDAHERQFGDAGCTRTPARRRGVHTDRRSGDVRRTRIAGPATSGTDGSRPGDVGRTRRPVQRRRAHTEAGPATLSAHGSPARRRQAHTDTGPATSGADGSPVQRRQAHTDTGSATLSAHGRRLGDVRRTRTAAVRPWRRPGNSERTLSSGVRFHRCGRPSPVHTNRPNVFPAGGPGPATIGSGRGLPPCWQRTAATQARPPPQATLAGRVGAGCRPPDPGPRPVCAGAGWSYRIRLVGPRQRDRG
jgi:hypothetical protein